MPTGEEEHELLLVDDQVISAVALNAAKVGVAERVMDGALGLTGAGFWANAAVTLLAADSVVVHAPVPVQAPLQPENV